MTPGWPPAVKVCGLTRHGDARHAVEAGASYLGVILAPGGKRSVTPEAARIIFGDLSARRVGVFVDAADAAATAAAAGVNVIQLHGDESPEDAARLREQGWEVWKALRPRTGAEFAEEAPRWAGATDALLLDGFSAAARGGTGASFPWAEVAARLDALPAGTGLVAAGGLRPENVAEAALALRPAVVDVSSGVESSPGIKDPDAVRRFVRAVRSIDSRNPTG
ncbi:MAG TPA: phosphoribosylanthranilate isomerase [Longimicrobium sp.]|nr:phosphoribosylanthranilate isomerase [Longimicrobium sp.]